MSDGMFVLPDDGCFIRGTLAGTDERISENDGKMSVKYRYLVVAGMEVFLVSSDNDYRPMLQIGDNVTFRVFPMVFGQKVYYTRAGFVQ